jgi:hypothetical protein
MEILSNGMPQICADYYDILLYACGWELMKSVGSDGSSHCYP